MSTALKKRLSRVWALEVNTGTDASPVWTSVSGIKKLTLNINGNSVDVTDFDSGGWGDSLTTERTWQVQLECWDGYTGPDNAQVDDPGQVALKAKGLLGGASAYSTINIWRTDTLRGYTGRVVVDYKGAGGGPKDAEGASFDLNGSGAMTPFTHS